MIFFVLCLLVVVAFFRCYRRAQRKAPHALCRRTGTYGCARIPKSVKKEKNTFRNPVFFYIRSYRFIPRKTAIRATVFWNVRSFSTTKTIPCKVRWGGGVRRDTIRIYSKICVWVISLPVQCVLFLWLKMKFLVSPYTKWQRTVNVHILTPTRYIFNWFKLTPANFIRKHSIHINGN